MKIRILTYSNAHNYGAVLQSYGLQEVLKNLGCSDVKHINYKPNYLSRRYNPLTKEYASLFLRGVKGVIHYLFFSIRSYMRNHAFRKSIDELLDMTEHVYGENDIIRERCDYLICGSDQIWNKDITKSFDTKFFGEGEYESVKGIISYAPSTEVNSLTDEKIQDLIMHLGLFDSISVRENELRNRIMRISPNINVSVCIDPTLLAGRLIFDKIACPINRGKPYILVYSYNPYADSMKKIISSIPNRELYDVVTILLCPKTLHSVIYESDVYDNVTVPQFVSLFKYASFVVTNSFHGLAFSLIFEKNFNVLKEENKYLRVKSLLDSLELQNRLISDVDSISWSLIDYIKVNRIIDKQREESLGFLKKSMSL